MSAPRVPRSGAAWFALFARSARFPLFTALAAIAALAAPAGGALAQGGLPTIEAVEGSIAPSKAAIPVSAASTDELIVINTATTKREPAAFSIDSEGNYLIVITKDASLNGTTLALRLRKGSDTYGLLGPDGQAAQFVYAGTLLGSSRLRLDMRIGSKITSSTPPVAAPAAPAAPAPPARLVNTNPDAVECIAAKFDVNGDGKCDEADLQQIQDALRLATPTPSGTAAAKAPVEDVNGDGVLSMRDLLEAIRALQQARIAALRKEIDTARSSAARPSAPARPANTLSQDVDAARAAGQQRPGTP